MKNKRVENIKEALRQPYTWPGAYPKAFLVHDGVLCSECVRRDFKVIVNDTRMNVGPWNVRVDVLWEGVFDCVECSKPIETAYGPERDEEGNLAAVEE